MKNMLNSKPLVLKQKSARGLTYFASIGMAQQEMYSPQKWVHSIVMPGDKLRSTCILHKIMIEKRDWALTCSNDTTRHIVQGKGYYKYHHNYLQQLLWENLFISFKILVYLGQREIFIIAGTWMFYCHNWHFIRDGVAWSGAWNTARTLSWTLITFLMFTCNKTVGI